VNYRGVIHFGVRYLRRNRTKAALLVSAFTLVWLLPAAIALVVDRVESQLRSRASETPLVLGHAGSALELTFNALYFTKPGIATLPMKEVDRVRETGLAEAIPLYGRFSVGDHRIVGTSIDYFRFRGFEFASGRALVRMGEGVVGADVARENEVRVGDSLISSPESLLDLAGVYPLKMSVCGILEPTGSPDDQAVFVDLKTAWVIEGLGHGHEKASEASAEQRLEPSGDGAIRLNASIMEYNEITPENEDSFHFHGDTGDNPISAIIVIPGNAKDQAMIKGKYGSSKTLQMVSPGTEMDELFETVFSVQRVVLWLLVAVGVATFAIGGLVFLLSHRLRREEFRHLRHMGAAPGALRALIGFEAAFVIGASLVFSAIGLGLVWWLAPIVIQGVLG
jgi:putative ABC transport system permease protein